MTPAAPVFEVEVGDALGSLQRRLRALVEALPGSPVRAPDLVRTLGIDRNLAWKVHKLVFGSDPTTVGPYVPGRGAMRALADSLREHGADPGGVASVLEAFERYRGVVDRHAGDRASAELMLSARAGGRRDGADLGLRRGAFRASSYLAGIRMRTHLSAFVVAPGTEAECLDIVSIKGFYDIERIRPGAPFVMNRPRAAIRTGAYTTEMPWEPIEPPPAGVQIPLLEDFCSKPVPEFRAVTGEGGFIEDELAERPVGRTGACTIVRATIARNLLPMYQTGDDRFVEMSARLRIPCQTLVLDKFVHEDAYGKIDPEAKVYGELTSEGIWTGGAGGRRERFIVPTADRVERLGRGLDVIATPEAARYPALMERVLGRLGWDPSRFEVWRIRMEMPLVPTTVMMVHEQKPRP